MPEQKEIVLDCLGVRKGELRGGDRYITGIVEELVSRRADFIIVANETWRNFLESRIPASFYVIVPIKAKIRTLRMLSQMTVGRRLAKRYNCSIYVSSNMFPPVGFPCPAAAILHDLQIFHFPEYYGRMAWKTRTTLLKISASRLSAVFTSSRSSAKDILARLKPKEIKVVAGASKEHIAPEISPDRQRFVLEELNLNGRKFVLAVLSDIEHKNHRGLVAAFEKLAEWGRTDVEIVVVGDAKKVFNRIKHPETLHSVGYVSDETLAVLYSNATAMVFPTLFEGFGLPVVEAQAAGLPVICSQIDVLKEVAGQGAIFFDPRSPQSMAESILKVVDSVEVQNQLKRLGQQNAATYTWKRSADEFLAACAAIGKRAMRGETSTVLTTAERRHDQGNCGKPWPKLTPRKETQESRRRLEKH